MSSRQFERYHIICEFVLEYGPDNGSHVFDQNVVVVVVVVKFLV